MSFNSLLHSLIEIPRIHSRKINTDSPGAFTQCMTDPLLNQTYCQRVSSALWVTVRDFVVTLKNKKVLKQAACRLRSSQLLRHVAQQQRAFTFVVFARHDKDMFFFARYNQYRGLYFNIFHPKNNCWALNCWWDRSSRTVLILHGMNSTRWWKHFLRLFVHIDMIASHSWCRSMTSISRPTTTQRCSVEMWWLWRLFEDRDLIVLVEKSV